MNDFEAPSLRDGVPPPVFTTIRAHDVNYNMDFVVHLSKQEVARRAAAGEPALSKQELQTFQAELISKLIIQGDVTGAIGHTTKGK